MSNEKYYVPHGTYWPIIGSIGISTLFVRATRTGLRRGRTLNAQVAIGTIVAHGIT